MVGIVVGIMVSLAVVFYFFHPRIRTHRHKCMEWEKMHMVSCLRIKNPCLSVQLYFVKPLFPHSPLAVPRFSVSGPLCIFPSQGLFFFQISVVPLNIWTLDPYICFALILACSPRRYSYGLCPHFILVSLLKCHLLRENVPV